jgi:hypothetical protein
MEASKRELAYLAGFAARARHIQADISTLGIVRAAAWARFAVVAGKGMDTSLPVVAGDTDAVLSAFGA